MGVKKGVWTRKQRRFVEEYCVDFNGTQAAIRSGYSKDSAGVIACALLKKTKIRRAIKERMRLLAMGNALTTERVQQELACMALANVVDVLSVDDLRKLPIEVQRSITGFKIRREVKEEVRDGEAVNVPYEVIEVKFAKDGAIRDAMRYLGMLVDRTKHEGQIDLTPIRIVEVKGSSSKEGSDG